VRYSAFISYSHHDVRWAAWLHRAIEAYRIPRHLRGQPGPYGPIGARLPPVFRDRDELRAGADLSQALNAAIDESGALIVICSPHSVGSRWVNEEIRHFTQLGRAERIFCLIVSDSGGAVAAEHMPPALLEGGTEPLAADVRKGKDGRAYALLKLVAALLEVDYDALRQREVSRRHRRMAVIAAASLAGLVLTSGLAVYALISRNEAVRQRDIAEQRTVAAERTVDFVKSMFKVSDPSEARGSTISAREILDRGAAQIQSGLGNEPAVKAQLGVTLGEVYESLGLYDEGDRLIRQTLQIRTRQDAITEQQLLALGDSQEKLGAYDDAIATDLRAVSLGQRSPDVGADLKSRAYEQLAQAQSDNGLDGAAERSATAALAIDKARKPQDSSDVARDLEALGGAYMAERHWPQARQQIEQALALRLKAEGPLSPSVADNLNSLGVIAWNEGDLAAAESDYQRVTAIDEKVFAADHPDVAAALNNLARVRVDRREFGAAIPPLQRAVAINLKQRDPSDDAMAYVYSNLALAKRGVGRTAEAKSLFEKALSAARKHHHPMLAPILSELADGRCRAGDVAGGKAMLAEAAPIMRAAFPADPWRAAWVDNVLGECLLAAGDIRGGRALIGASTPIVLARWDKATLYGHEAARRLQLVKAHK
jgi:tetratricopeptide (TPR) repeat protein